AGTDVRRVRAPGAELVATGDAIAAVDAPGGADGPEHPRVDALDAVREHGRRGVGAGVDRGEARRRDVRHRRPTGGAGGVRDLLEDGERGGDVDLQTAELARDLDPEQPGAGERLD